MILLTALLLFAIFTGLVMEIYKKVLRKDKAQSGEIEGVAFGFSFLFGIVSYLVLTTDALPLGLGHSPFVIILYAVAIYILQLPACMALWKPIIHKVIERKLDV